MSTDVCAARSSYYCCGMDHFKNCGLSRGMRRGVGLVVLPRGADDAGSSTTRTKAEDSTAATASLVAKAKCVSDPKKRIVGCDQCPPALSSTLIRKHLSSLRGAVGAKGKGAAALARLDEWLPEGVFEVMMRGDQKEEDDEDDEEEEEAGE